MSEEENSPVVTWASLVKSTASLVIPQAARNRLDAVLRSVFGYPLQRRSLDDRAAVQAFERAQAAQAIITEKAAAEFAKQIEGNPELAAAWLFFSGGHHDDAARLADVLSRVVSIIPSQLAAGSDETDNPVSAEFVSRVTANIRHATSEELKNRWAGVIASEVLRPGTFSTRVLRIVDEIEVETANTFAKLAQLDVDGVIPLIWLQKEAHSQAVVANLAEAGLVLPPSGFSWTQILFKLEESDGNLGDVFPISDKAWAVGVGEWGDMVLSVDDSHTSFRLTPYSMTIPILRLTAAGKALSTIIPKRAGIEALASDIADLIRPRRVQALKWDIETSAWVSVKEFRFPEGALE